MNSTGRPGISFTEVSAAAERIVARGERPNARSVRLELGETGSLGTIQRHLTAWQEGRRPAVVATVTLPDELQRAMLGHIERRVAEARADVQTELAETQAARDVLAEELERQSATLATAEQRITEQAAGLERQAGTIATLERTLADASTAADRERKAAEDARKETALAQLRLESLPQLHDEIKSLRAELTTERDARLRAEIAAAELRGPSGGKAV